MAYANEWLGVVLLLAAASEGGALRCWSCMSDVVAACGEPFEPQELPGPSACPALQAPLTPSMPPPRSVCYTAVIKLNEVETHVYRACDWAGGAAGSQEGAEFCARAPAALPAHAQLLSCRSCFTDGCNGAPAGLSPAAAASTATPRHALPSLHLATLGAATAAAWLRA